ncbi:hypothetical protein PVAG01_01161 [Phlyctema vagabunda]|uniref:Uncharacterized protein n=1 Tax=Phlyctema vagabunda TaxID=108571 RepID=A0ABR4PWB0_9HELO
MSQGYLNLNDTSRVAKQISVTCAKDEVLAVTDVVWSRIRDEIRAQSMRQDTVPLNSSVVRLHVLATDPPDLNGSLRLARTSIPVPSEIISLVAISLEDYEALWQNDAGSTSLLEEPRRFLMQTPNDGGSFCSLIIQTNRPPVLGNANSNVSTARENIPFNTILITSESESQLSKIAKSFTVPPVWNTTDLPMVVVPLEFLIKHVRQVSETLAELTSEISIVEEVVIGDNDTTDFKGLIKKLHLCSRELVKLRRRWHFQMTLAGTIRELIEIHDPVIAAARRDETDALLIHGGIRIESNGEAVLQRGTIMGDVTIKDDGRLYSDMPLKPKKDPLTDSREYRQLLSAASLQLKLSQSLEYDLSVLPERIANQFNAIFNLMAQRDTQASMSVAESSRKDNLYMQDIADATLRDSSSMKTIAVLTMVFLPGTFICSFFSMTMFNWNNQPNEPLVSSYIWVYFVAMVPLTLLVLAVWWWKTRESRREQEENKRKRTLARGNTWGGAYRPKKNAW